MDVENHLFVEEITGHSRGHAIHFHDYSIRQQVSCASSPHGSSHQPQPRATMCQEPQREFPALAVRDPGGDGWNAGKGRRE